MQTYYAVIQYLYHCCPVLLLVGGMHVSGSVSQAANNNQYSGLDTGVVVNNYGGCGKTGVEGVTPTPLPPLFMHQLCQVMSIIKVNYTVNTSGLF